MKKIFLLIFGMATACNIQAQVGIGTETPHPSSILDVASDSKGVLYPRVTLTSTIDQTTVASPATGLMVYNTGTDSGFTLEGYVFWNGSEWRKMDDSKIIAPMIDELQCGSASLTPMKYVAGIPYKGTMSVPYVGGNGGQYPATPPSASVNGLTCARQAGTLSDGSGIIQYTVEGVPTGTAPGVLTTFNLDFYGKSCLATVGTTNEYKFIRYVVNTVSPIDATTLTASETTIGDLVIRFNATAPAISNKIEYKVLKDNHVSMIYHKAGSGGVNLERYVQNAAQVGVWYDLKAGSVGTGGNATIDLNSVNRDLGTLLIELHNSKRIYRVSMNANGSISANGVVPLAPSSITIFIEELQ